MNEKRPNCPKCGNEEPVRNGHACNRQRWKCKSCDFEFTRLTSRGKSPALKTHAIELRMSGLSYQRIGVLLNVSAKAISNWVNENNRNLLRHSLIASELENGIKKEFINIHL